MSDSPDALARQIAELEASLAHPLPASARQLIEQQLVTLRQQQRAALVDLRGAQMGDATIGDVAGRDAVKGTTHVSGTVEGAAVGVNQGTIQVFFGGQPPAPASPPAGAATPEQIAAQRGILDAHRATLATLLTQQATLGSAYAPPAVAHGIREARAGIARAKTALRGWGVAVADGPDDIADNRYAEL